MYCIEESTCDIAWIFRRLLVIWHPEHCVPSPLLVTLLPASIAILEKTGSSDFTVTNITF